MSGVWTFPESRAEYRRTEDVSQTPVGVLLSPCRIRNGRVSARIHLENPGEDAGRLLLGYNVATGGYYSAGLGGYNRAYVIDEHVPGLGWQPVAVEGSAAQLDGATTYAVAVDISGQRLRLTVNGVEVMEQHLPHPLEGYQAGLFAWGTGPVAFEDIESSERRRTAFVVMEFSEPFDSLYTEVIRPVCREMHVNATRADDIFRPGLILQDIISGLVESDVIIAEITPPNPNVFYELGYAHAQNTPTVLLALRDHSLPFDIRGHRVIFYDDSIRGRSEVQAALTRHLSSIFGDRRDVTDRSGDSGGE